MTNKWLLTAIGVLAVGLVVNFAWTARQLYTRPALTEGEALDPTLWWTHNTFQPIGTFAAPRMQVNTTADPADNWRQGGGSVVTSSTGRWAA